MHSMLFIATIIPERHDWASFLEHVDQRIDQEEDVDRLAENVWLVNMKTAATAFGELVHLAVRAGISYGLLPFEHAPEWLPVDFDPNTILAHRVEHRD